MHPSILQEFNEIEWKKRVKATTVRYIFWQANDLVENIDFWYLLAVLEYKKRADRP